MENILKMVNSFDTEKKKILTNIETQIKPLSLPTRSGGIFIIQRSQLDNKNWSVEHNIRNLGGDPRVKKIADRLTELIQTENFVVIGLALNSLEVDRKMFGFEFNEVEAKFFLKELKNVL